MNQDKKLNTQASQSRWADIAALWLAGTSTTILIIHAIDCTKTTYINNATTLSAATLTAAALWRWFEIKPNLLFGLKHLKSYPPTILPAIAGTLTVIATTLLFPQSVLSPTCAIPTPPMEDVVAFFGHIAIFASIAVTTITVTAIAINLLRLKYATKKTQTPLAYPEWLKTDASIQLEDEDLFDHTKFATHLTTLIDSDAEPTIALIGETGSGKSSILNLASKQLTKSNPNTCIIRLSLWPFESTQAAIAGVLNAILEQLSNHVPVYHLKGLSTDYIDAIEGTGLPLIKAIRLAKPDQPSLLLKKIDTTALATRIKIFLWIEDFERFAGLHKSTGEPEYARLGPLRALLNELSELKSIQVLLASSAADYRFDLEKLVQFAINIPRLQEKTTSVTVQTNRQFALQKFPGEIDPATPDERNRLWPQAPDKSPPTWHSDADPDSLAGAVSILCSTPRKLKQTLRHFSDTWDKLHGEIDIDDLLMISVIQNTSPTIHAAIAKHVRTLRMGAGRAVQENNESKFKNEITPHLNSLKDDEREAVKLLLNELFPGWDKGKGGSAASKKRPQALASTQTDYWGRYASRTPPSEAESDQRALSSIGDWAQGKTAPLMSVLASQSQPSSLITFLSTRVTEDQLLTILEETTSTLTRMKITHLTDRSIGPEGIVSIWLAMLNNRPPEQALAKSLRKLISDAIPENLVIAFSLVNIFATTSNNVDSLIPKSEAKEISAHLSSAIMDFFKDKPSELASNLDGSRPHTLFWSIWGLDRIRAEDTSGLPGEQWPQFSTTLLESASSSPEIMLPQILTFATRRRSLIRNTDKGGRAVLPQYSFDKEAADRLFGTGKLLEILHETRSTTLMDPASNESRNSALEDA
ncbi:P-loop NTPase fold protein [Corallococcus sp. 4LFB]|uniref:P-loop NTPase fold protein n=1 Tax=Corallococcus sp. 4LFB TaxID=3383249 RepID=UPI0039769DB2